MGKHHNFVFGDWDQITERTNEELNSRENLLDQSEELRGQYQIPYLDYLSVERGRLFEVMGWVEQKNVQRQNIQATAAELGQVNRAWRAYFMAEQAKVKRKNKGASEEEICAIIWEKFLNYRGKKKVWRLRGAPLKKGQENMTNRKVLSQSISRDGLEWQTNSEKETETPLEVIRGKKNNLYGYAEGLKKKMNKFENGEYLRGLKRQLVQEIEDDFGVCQPEDFEMAMAEIKARVMSYLEVDPCAHLGKKKRVRKDKASVEREEVLVVKKEEPALQQTLDFEAK